MNERVRLSRLILSQWLRQRMVVGGSLLLPLLLLAGLRLLLPPPADDGDPRPRILLLAPDPDELLSTTLLRVLEQQQQTRPTLQPLTELETPLRDLRAGQWAAVVELPPQYTETLMVGKRATLQVRLDETTRAGLNAQLLLSTAVERLLRAVELSRVSVATLERQQPLPGLAREARQLWVLNEALNVAQQLPAQVGVERLEGRVVPKNTRTLLQPERALGSALALTFLLGAGGLLWQAVRARERGVWARLLCTPLTGVALLSAYGRVMGGVLLVQGVLLLGVVGLEGGGFWGELPGVLLLSVCLGVWGLSLTLLVLVLSRRAEAAGVALGALALSLGVVGGAFSPLEVDGEQPPAWRLWSPMGSGLELLRRLLAGGDGASVWLPAGVLLLYALLQGGAALLVLSRRKI